MKHYLRNNDKEVNLISHFYGKSNMEIIEYSKGRTCEYCDLLNGKYVITEYEVFKGVRVFYNDIHTSKITRDISDTSLDEIIYEINHCREGRFECVLSDRTDYEIGRASCRERV